MRVVLCNCPPDAAPDLAHGLVANRLAACVNIVPGVRSLYVWEGRVCDDAESTLLIKVRAEGVPALREALASRHPYAVPEIVVLGVDVEASFRPYVDWVRGG